MWINWILCIKLVPPWVAGEKAQPSSGRTREKRPVISSEGHGDISYCIKSGRMSGIVASGKNFSITKYRLTTLMSFKIPNITWAVGHSSNLYTWVCRGLDGSTCSKFLPVGLATLNPQSTWHGPRPGPKLAHGVRSGSPHRGNMSTVVWQTWTVVLLGCDSVLY